MFVLFGERSGQSVQLPPKGFAIGVVWRAKRSLDGMRGKNKGLEGAFSGPDKSKNGFLQGAEVRGMIRIRR